VISVNQGSSSWEDIPCSRDRGVAAICQFHDKDVIPTEPATVPSTASTPFACPIGWELDSGHCYLLVEVGKHTWFEAEIDCAGKNVGGHLASIHSQSELDFILSLSRAVLWLGASDADTEVHT